MIGLQERSYPVVKRAESWRGNLCIDMFGQGFDQAVPISEMVVDGHRIDLMPICKRPHCEALDAPCVQQIERSRQNLLARGRCLLPMRASSRAGHVAIR